MQNHGPQSKNFAKPPPNAAAYYSEVNAARTTDNEKLGELHMRLNMLLAIPVKKIKAKEKNSLKTSGAQEILEAGKQVWTTPAMLVLFLQNTIELCTPTPVDGDATPLSPGTALQGATEELKLRLPAWQDFKALIYEIYDHRIFHAPEINGMINTTYMGMDEHLICFFCVKYQVRSQAEKRIIEFLASLKYFVDHWQRAKQYATLCGFLQADESFMRKSGTSETRPPARLNDGRFDELEIPGNDIFVQEFYLHCYSLLTKEKRNFQDSKEGFTYMMQKSEERASNKILTFVLPTDMTKWNMTVKRIIKKIKKDPSDDYDTEYVDVDTLLNMYIEWFKTFKKTQQKKLVKQFQRVTSTD